MFCCGRLLNAIKFNLLFFIALICFISLVPSKTDKGYSLPMPENYDLNYESQINVAVLPSEINGRKIMSGPAVPQTL